MEMCWQGEGSRLVLGWTSLPQPCCSCATFCHGTAAQEEISQLLCRVCLVHEHQRWQPLLQVSSPVLCSSVPQCGVSGELKHHHGLGLCPGNGAQPMELGTPHGSGDSPWIWGFSMDLGSPHGFGLPLRIWGSPWIEPVPTDLGSPHRFGFPPQIWAPPMDLGSPTVLPRALGRCSVSLQSPSGSAPQTCPFVPLRPVRLCPSELSLCAPQSCPFFPLRPVPLSPSDLSLCAPQVLTRLGSRCSSR